MTNEAPRTASMNDVPTTHATSNPKYPKRPNTSQ
ncbi:hypothetical protein SNOG_15485 [Parastagonospora nodorum SN15]|uniref:Uncharacterized protein n=1 Tax=Phaeosphaeria nodorum (strain SN15 / ATCC MYA-4574 / FGSC 10173) TaxID=321614 RepID=Q0TYE1_PHANO|nr:hypothetical protein SNOG_15485 [Parastagonospora nodorum SN15]EAT77150.1 hypothetical protein SNOG_15485 [Parastagonospora nodorum SN15]